MSTAERYIPHYTVEDYQQWQGDWELLEGIAIAMTPSPFGPHQRVLSNLIFLLEQQFRAQGCDCRAIAELDWVVTQDTVVRPDLMVICGELPERHLQHPPAMVVEVLSPSTAEKDQTTKKRIYLQQKVPVYMLIDPGRKQVHAVRQGVDGVHEQVYTSDDQIHLSVQACSFMLSISDVLQ
ncbi:MAG: Uma2 family endonuclease [Fuerstiella sp.]